MSAVKGAGVLTWFGRHWRIVLTVCSALVAAVLGAAVQEILDTELRFAAASVVVICILAVALLAALSATVAEVRQQEKSAASTGDAIVSLTDEIINLSRNLGMSVDTMLLSELNIAKTVKADRTTQLMLTATAEVRILDLLLEDGRWPDEAMDQSYQNNAFDAFVGLLQQAEPAISYKRIIQVSDPASSLKNARTSSLVKHCHDILDLRRANGGKASLRVTRRRFPFKFILIDDKAVVLQLEEYGRAPEDLKIWGEVLVNDPGGQLVRVFAGIWDELMDDPSTRTVTVSDLPERSPAPGDGTSR